MMTTGDPPGRSSSGTNARPCSGFMPRTENNPDETWRPETYSGSPGSLSFTFRLAIRHQIARVLLKMEAQFVLKLLLHLLSPPQALPPSHCAPPLAMPRIRPIASI